MVALFRRVAGIATVGVALPLLGAACSGGEAAPPPPTPQPDIVVAKWEECDVYDNDDGRVYVTEMAGPQKCESATRWYGDPSSGVVLFAGNYTLRIRTPQGTTYDVPVYDADLYNNTPLGAAWPPK